MQDVRVGVDAVDAALVDALALRQGYMDAAARIKPTRDKVRDEARIAQVLANVAALARARGLSWAIAEPVWRELIERSIAHELDAFDRRARARGAELGAGAGDSDGEDAPAGSAAS
jgi:isochorismate pyruvate lyase